MRSAQFAFASFLLLGFAAPAEAQYRRQIQAPEPLWAATVTVGGLLSFEESMTPVETPLPDDERRGRREVGASPWLSVAGRYGRGIAIYANASIALPGDAEVSGADPLTGAPLEGTVDAGLISIVSVGASFTPLRDAPGLRLELGPALVDLGDGGSYIALRAGAIAKFFEVGDRGAILIGWDGYFAGGQYDRDQIEYQVRGGLLHGVRLGYEYAW